MSTHRGFTLIELLVVIAVTGTLAGLVVTSLGGTRAKARDVQRQADFRNMSVALKLYKDKYDRYPPVPTDCCSVADHAGKFTTVAETLVSEGFLSAVPVAPQASTNPYMMHDYGGAIGPIQVVYLETISATTDPPDGTCRPFDNNWCSYSIASTAYCVCNPN